MIAVAVLGSAGCSQGPPPDLAPDPELLGRIRELVVSVPPTACPGRTFQVGYAARLEDGSEIPFAIKYDKKRPPPLHVVMLNRSSPDAFPVADGRWKTVPDPAQTVLMGFRLSVFLKDDPAINKLVTVAPEYSCLPTDFTFKGVNGRKGEGGGTGPGVTVRLAVLGSPFYERLLVAGVGVDGREPFYLFQDADRLPPSDWLQVASRGGRGGRGRAGAQGAGGRPGREGCPGTVGGAGGAGGMGGVGGSGGWGGRMTIIVPESDRFIAGLVTAENPGGAGGKGGPGGEGGKGGKGGKGGQGERRCRDGAAGPAGENGEDGPDGRRGRRGPPPEVIEVPLNEVFGPSPDPLIARLLEIAGK